jgi:hypothetical protein
MPLLTRASNRVSLLAPAHSLLRPSRPMPGGRSVAAAGLLALAASPGPSRAARRGSSYSAAATVPFVGVAATALPASAAVPPRRGPRPPVLRLCRPSSAPAAARARAAAAAAAAVAAAPQQRGLLAATRAARATARAARRGHATPQPQPQPPLLCLPGGAALPPRELWSPFAAGGQQQPPPLRFDTVCPYTPGTIKSACWKVLESAGAGGLTSAEIVEQARGLLPWGAAGAAKTPRNSVVAALSQEGANFVRVAPCTYALRKALQPGGGGGGGGGGGNDDGASAGDFTDATAALGAVVASDGPQCAALMALSLAELRAAFAERCGRKTTSKNKMWLRNRLSERAFAGDAAAGAPAEAADSAPADGDAAKVAAPSQASAPEQAAPPGEADELSSPRRAVACAPPAEAC